MAMLWTMIWATFPIWMKWINWSSGGVGGAWLCRLVSSNFDSIQFKLYISSSKNKVEYGTT